MADHKPEYRCPECGSTKLTVVFKSTVTYTQRDDGTKDVQSTEDDSLDFITCDCGEESDGDDDSDWKNKEK